MRRPLVALLAFLLAAAAPAAAQSRAQQRFIAAMDAMMTELAPQSLRASAEIRDVYGEHFTMLLLPEFGALHDALTTGGLAPLPPGFNVTPRLDGLHPLGEKDLGNQTSYISARPAAIGCLLEVASRVKSGPVEVTSLVRHGEYQDALRTTNANANTSLPMHAMGLAFDIALVNTPLATVREIRDVLLEMRDAGDLLFIGERRQLVFHVVPHPSRLGYFTDVYARAFTSPDLLRGRAVNPVLSLDAPPTPNVETALGPVVPPNDLADEWWAAGGLATDFTIEVTAAALDAAVQRPVGPGASRAGDDAANILIRGFTAILNGVRRLFSAEPS